MTRRTTGAAILATFLTTVAALAAEPRLSAGGSMIVVLPDSPHFVGLKTLKVDERPLACFGVVRAKDGRPRYSYLFIFNTPPGREDGFATETKGSFEVGEEFHGDVTAKVTVAEKQVEVAYRFRYDDARKAFDETLKVGGQEVAADGPRVYLVDVRGDKPTYTPVVGDGLDARPTNFELDGYTRGAYDTIQTLKESSEAVKKFLE